WVVCTESGCHGHILKNTDIANSKRYSIRRATRFLVWNSPDSSNGRRPGPNCTMGYKLYGIVLISLGTLHIDIVLGTLRRILPLAMSQGRPSGVRSSCVMDCCGGMHMASLNYRQRMQAERLPRAI